MKPRILSIVALASLLGLIGCNDSSDYDFDASAEDAQEAYEDENDIQPRPLFNPVEGIIPSATNLLFLGSTDGTLNIPIDPLESAGAQALKATLNELDGFSTISPITVEFSTSLDPDSVVAGDSVRLFEVSTTLDGAVTGVIREVAASEYELALTGDNQEILMIHPQVPLQELTSYLVVFTNGINDAAGVPATADFVYKLLKSTEPFTGDLLELEPLRLLTQTFEDQAVAATENTDQEIVKDDIVLSWVFSTQSITPVLSDVADTAAAGTINLVATPYTTRELLGTEGAADVWIGTLEVPYYLTAPSAEDPTAPLTKFWTDAEGDPLTWLNTTPAATSNQTIPVLMTLPNADSASGGTPPAEGWPVVIFLHGMTQDRTNLLAIADTLANAGFAAIAIDLPLHGITDVNNGLHADQTAFPDDRERTFDMDLINNETGDAGADGAIDPSGKYFINLSSLLTSRDNLRQTVSDLLVLHKSLSEIMNVELNTQQVYFVGHSLGAIAGSVFLAMDDTVGAASLAMPGGGIARLLDGSATFGEEIVQGLAANGVIKGTADYDTFMVVAQTAMDSGDPINFAEMTAALHPIHLMEVVGGSGNLPDQVVPNSVYLELPSGEQVKTLSGTEPLARAMELESVIPNDAGVFMGPGIVRFTEGDHSSVLDPTSSPAATAEMQSEIASFILSSGSQIVISNPDVILME